MTRLYAALAGVSLIALTAGGIWWSAQNRADDPFAQCRAGQVAGAAIGGPFELIDESGAAVTDAQVLTKPSLVYFGYSFCPDVCPLDNARNAAAVDILEETGYDVTPVFITIDPARDTPGVLADFTDYLHPRMMGLTGTQEQIGGAVRAYKAYAKKQESGDEYYLMDHSTFTYLMLPGTGFADFFRREMTSEEMASRVACYLTPT